MLETGQNWELFGYDMRQLGKHWLAAWRGLVWADDSPLRQRLDEVVCLRSEAGRGETSRGETGTALYQGGRPCAGAPHECEAILLPEELVLTRALRLPLAVEGDLESVLGFEVNANSPFAADDTGHGWQLAARDETHLHLVLVIVSMSSVMAYLGKTYDIHDPRQREVWAETDAGMVVLRGFGEGSRAARYRRRLLRCAAMLGASALLILLIAALAAGAKRAELAQVQALSATTQREAAQASRMRSALARANETIGASNEVVGRYPNPHFELARLTRLLDDSVYIVQFAMSGREIRLRGRATDAASVMQQLTDQPFYAEVTAPQAIVKVGNTGLEQFSLNILLAVGVSG